MEERVDSTSEPSVEGVKTLGNESAARSVFTTEGEIATSSETPINPLIGGAVENRNAAPHCCNTTVDQYEPIKLVVAKEVLDVPGKRIELVVAEEVVDHQNPARVPLPYWRWTPLVRGEDWFWDCCFWLLPCVYWLVLLCCNHTGARL